MPYRLDLPDAGEDVLDRLVELGAIDADASPGAGIAALMPDSVAPEQVARHLRVASVDVSPATGRDADSVWILGPRPIQAGRLRIVPDGTAAMPGDLRLIDAGAFGTGLHPTTALCLEALDDLVRVSPPPAVLDVGTGSGVLALAALMLGVDRGMGIDVDAGALQVAAANARLNAMGDWLALRRGGPDAIDGTWPLVLANVLAAPLIEMAPVLVRRLGHRGRLVLSGIPAALEQDVDRVYRRLGLYRLRVDSRGGWLALVFQASW